MTTVDMISLTKEKSDDLMLRGATAAWLACATISSRLYVLSSPGWEKWPSFADTAQEAYSLAILRCCGADADAPSESLQARLDEFSVEDDGSAEWGFALNLVIVFSSILSGQDVERCLNSSLRCYLGGMFNVISNDYAVTAGGVISRAAAMEKLSADSAWQRTVDLVRSL